MIRLFALSIVLSILGAAACTSAGSASPPASPPVSGQDAATSDGSGSGAAGAAGSSPADSAIGDLFNANAATPGTIRSAQVTQLKSEVDALENILSIYQQVNCIGREGEVTTDDLRVIPTPSGSGPTTLAGGAFTAAGDVGVGALLGGQGATTAFQQGATALGAGVTAQVNQTQVATDVAAIAGTETSELQQCNDEVTNLQNQIQQKNAQIDELNAEGTQ